jgi:uncharacterized membrane protein YoaK (UPF0700 family)
MYRALTEAAIIVHLAFIAFVIAGGLLTRRYKWLIPFHLGALAWAVYAELSPGVVCPLTAVENYFALRAGIAEYRGDFVAHYLVPVIYQERLPPKWQLVLTLFVILLNLAIYLSFVFVKKRWSSRA